MKALITTLAFALSTVAVAADTVVIDAGTFKPAIRLNKTEQNINIAAFALDRNSVSEQQFANFVLANPQWQRSQVPIIFADKDYLRHWQDEVTPAHSANADTPVTRVSWFAARAYCQAQGGRLPTLNEWEYSVQQWREQQQLSDANYAKLVFSWFSNPQQTLFAEQITAGPAGLIGKVNEWVDDFQLLLTNGDDVDALSGSCGDTARFMAEFDTAHYASFLRYQSRSNYRPQSTTSTLGFRCAYSVRSNK
ncbi:formylglycine-generating enzyme family protein [Rheinheimera sp. D18]|uniref:formylglycine-generating enzyme family protein n=1 Tax=Rheinheimera sp. D18 TaxID=2545632 RepID=UPI0010508047|nr:formylglycine-generating enzyme family protein [Rheinheimera sp. D18]QBL09689.1 formylglycine-generating enzyme family protein [Rheinheimera sp. D18]